MVDELLERFPGPITLYASQRKWLAILAGCAVFVGIGVSMITSPAFFNPSYLGIPADIIGWLEIVLFGLGLIVSVVALMPGRSHLTLDANGFTVRNLFRSFDEPLGKRRRLYRREHGGDSSRQENHACRLQRSYTSAARTRACQCGLGRAQERASGHVWDDRRGSRAADVSLASEGLVVAAATRAGV